MLNLQPIEAQWLGGIPSLDPNDPRPFLLPGVRVRFAPIGIKAVRAAREAVRESLQADPEDLMTASDALSREVIRRGVAEWEGIGDKDGNPVGVTPESIELFLADPNAFEAADWVYVRPWGERDTEGNVSAGSPSGTGAAETPADDIVPSRATRKRKAGANRTRKPARKAVPIS